MSVDIEVIQVFVYRLEKTRNELPTHWAYNDAWIADGRVGVIDNRTEGFQVWGSLPEVVEAILGLTDVDGDYTIDSGYEWLHVIEASDIEDGGGVWFAVHPRDVASVRVVRVHELLDEWKPLALEAIEDAEEDDEDLEVIDWCEEHQSEMADWLEARIEKIQPIFVDTLPNPYEVEA
ncbi:hypothetical protein S7335_1316 [Synechococcus sp. PCC 7335]|uniref:hypothetical protein n=1 Tax=Synechococcus sp. (strain ATCC 29403 / PCC 7335) TaxID=91464 RepID=UPI00017EB939|nr:hypothetical protein [Synechococcus sp. PCC 7335]EDX82612.1 hypothetical protein S7335_1316 [Synechococcus sp. PCC 7335]